MLYNTISFIFFFIIVLLGYWVLPNKVRYIWLLLVSYYFYCVWDAKFTILLFASTIITYVCGLSIERVQRREVDEKSKDRAKKVCVLLAVFLNLGALAYFKYTNFMVENLNLGFAKLNLGFVLPAKNIVLPLGLSFYAFQVIGYTIDVYRGDIPAERNFLKYALFVSFFPKMVSGPIERSKNLLAQIGEEHRFSFQNLKTGCLWMLWGYFLKLVIADRLGIIVNTVYGDPQTYQGLYIVGATVLYGIQIYCDFNGYTTIARGCAKIMGFDLIDNFNAPYFAKNVSDFWRRWHISLTSWFRDYLYIPLGGNRKGQFRKHINVLIVFTVSGLWHGAAWGFVIWGMLNGMYQVISGWFRPLRQRFIKEFGIDCDTLSHKILQVVGTFALIDFSWLFFRAENLNTAVAVLKNMCVFNPEILFTGGFYNLGIGKNQFLFLMAMIVILTLADYLKYKKINLAERILAQGAWLRIIVFASLFWVIILLGIYGVGYDTSSFIYSNF